MSTPPTMDDVQRLLLELSKTRDENAQTKAGVEALHSDLRKMARGISDIVKGLNLSDSRQAGVAESTAATRAALVDIFDTLGNIEQLIGDVELKVDPSTWTAEQLALFVKNPVICLARQIQYAQSRGEPLPLGPAPTELVPLPEGTFDNGDAEISYRHGKITAKNIPMPSFAKLAKWGGKFLPWLATTTIGAAIMHALHYFHIL